jgi:cob(I)alamin adenosyltransferase
MIIKDAKQISTGHGDEGFTRNLANELISKDDQLFETMGTLDELSAILGLCFRQTLLEFIKTIQRTIQTINTGIAFDPSSHQKTPSVWEVFGSADVQILEKEEQRLLDLKPLDGRFSLPGSDDSLPGAHFNWARTVCRRGERAVVRYIRQSGRTDLGNALKYMNRLSDLLFILAKNS